MALINEAHDIRLGPNAADRVYLGENKVWDKADVFVWPNDSNTGVPEGTVLTVDDRNAIIANDEVFEDIHFTTTLQWYLGATGTIFRRCLFTGGPYYNVLGGDNFLTFEDCTFDGLGVTERNVAARANFLRCNFKRARLAIVIYGGATNIEYNYAHDFIGPFGTHFDAIFAAGGQAGMVIKDNYFDMPGEGTASIFIHTQDGPSPGPITIEHNRLLGAPSYTLYTTGSEATPLLADITIINNEFARGQFGYYIREWCPNVISLSGNRDADTFANIDAAMGGPIP